MLLVGAADTAAARAELTEVRRLQRGRPLLLFIVIIIIIIINFIIITR